VRDRSERVNLSAVEFHYGRVSGNSARVAFALHEAGIAYVPRCVDTRGGENRGATYRALNPMGKVPALVDGDVRLWESNAINLYLAETHPEAGLVPSSVAGRASTNRWLFFQASHVSPACAAFFRAANPRTQAFWGTKPDGHAANAARAELARYLPVLEDALAGHEWLDGAFSLADIAYAPHLWLIADGGYDFAATPAVRAWLDRLVARPAWRKTAAMIFDE
jgi:glutathione S-transferase